MNSVTSAAPAGPLGALADAPRPRLRGKVKAGFSKLVNGVQRNSGWPTGGLLASHPSMAVWCLLLYGFVVHSFKILVAQEALIAGLLFVLIGGKFRLPRPLLWLGGYAAWGFITAPASPYFAEALGGAYEFAKVWVIAFLVVNAIQTRPQLRFFTIGWLAMFGLFPVRGVIFSWLGGYTGTFGGRIGWNFSFRNPNDLAALCLIPIAVCIGLLQVERTRWLRLVALAGLASTTLVVVLTQSRGGQLALMTLGLLTLLGQKRKARIVMALGAVAVVVALAVPPKYFDRVIDLKALTGGVKQVGTVDKDGSAIQRYNIWKVAIAIAKERPITGAGMSTYSLAHGDTWRHVQGLEGDPSGRRDAHSTYFRVLAESGLPGFILWCGMLVSTFMMVRRALPRLREEHPGMDAFVIAIVTGQIAFLQAGIFNSFAHQPYFYVYVMLTVVTVELYTKGAGASVPARGRLAARLGRPDDAPPTGGPAIPELAPRPVRRPGMRGGLAHTLDWSGPAGPGR
jgi:probable O-glycosylation ligase (exosortase A-associated)